VKRRSVLAAIGSLGSLGALHYTTRPRPDTLEVRFWLSEHAAQYDIVETIQAYLEWALDYDFWSVDVSYGGHQVLEREQGAWPVRSGRWPLRVGAGGVGADTVETARDVNLLVTAGEMNQAPTGYAMPHIASVGGAQYLEALGPPVEQSIRPYTRSNFSMQVLLHEVGHTLGLQHDHGTIFKQGPTTVATPMVSAYAWDDEFQATHSRCGDAYVPRDQREETREGRPARAISLEFSSCSRDRLSSYRGGVRP